MDDYIYSHYASSPTVDDKAQVFRVGSQRAATTGELRIATESGTIETI